MLDGSAQLHAGGLVGDGEFSKDQDQVKADLGTRNWEKGHFCILLCAE